MIMEEKSLGKLLLTRNEKRIYVKDNVITKVFSHSRYSTSDVIKEAMNQAYALEQGFNVPSLIDIFPVGDDFAISSEKIEGKTLAELIQENPDDKKKYIQKLVKIQLEILSHLSSNLKLPKLKDKLNSYIAESELDSTTKFELSSRLEKMPNHYKFCHGDICPENIILKGDEYFILDWAHATRGNASADASMTYLLFLLSNDEKGADMYIKEFSKRAQIDLSYIYEWVSVVSASKLRSADTEEKKELLLRNISVVEY